MRVIGTAPYVAPVALRVDALKLGGADPGEDDSGGGEAPSASEP
jgi:hypothetical protein